MNCSYIVLKEPVWPVDLLGGGSGLFPFGAPPSDPKCTRPNIKCRKTRLGASFVLIIRTYLRRKRLAAELSPPVRAFIAQWSGRYCR